MRIRCCVFDLDGTLLNSKSQISKEDLAALLAAKARGLQIVVATGRTDLQIAQYLAELEIDGPTIACNGGLIKNHRTGEIYDVKYFEPDRVKKIVDHCLAEGLDFLLYTPLYVYHAPGSERIKIFENYNKTAKPEFQVPIRTLDELPKENPFGEINKVLIIHDLVLMPEIERLFNADGALTIVTSGPKLIDIMPGKTTKGDALATVSKILNIPISEIAAFGDSPNDESMLSAAGVAVVMGNASDEMKKFGDVVTLTNDEGGIKYALEHLLTLA